jgi:tetratricopeptide (TPR) repeat protein
VLVCLGLAHQSRGDLAAAQHSYERASSWDRQDVTALAGRGYVLLQRGRYDAAAAEFRAALAIDPRSQDALRFLGLAYADKGDRAKAEGELKRAIDIDPKDPWPVMIRAITAARDGDRRTALADAARALEIAGARSSDGLLVRGAVHYFLEDFDQARADIEASIRLNGDNGQAHRMLSRLLIRQGRLEEAQRSLDAAARLMPNDVTVLLQQGLIALRRRDYGVAVRELTRSLDINDAHAEGFAARGQAHEGQGQVAAAIADYRTASTKLAVDGDGRRARALAAERLAALTAAPAATRPKQPAGADAGSPAQNSEQRPTPPDQPLYCRLVEGTFAHSRKYTGVAFDIGCSPRN